tara:strand:- start:1239 stop:1388 length:150 start_codon:yes stop_codon:yes gene_type:complete
MNDRELAFIRLEQLKLAKTVALEIIRDCAPAVREALEKHFDALIQQGSE